MTVDEVRALLLGYPEAVEEEPFGPGTLVFKVDGKIFAIVGEDAGADRTRPQVSLKCEPGLALELRAMYPAVRAGYHLNKRHWNTVTLDGSVPQDEVLDMIAHSYDRVVAGLPKSARERLTRS